MLKVEDEEACRRCWVVEAKFEASVQRRSTPFLHQIMTPTVEKSYVLRLRTSSEERTATKAAPLIGDDLGGAHEKGCEVEV